MTSFRQRRAEAYARLEGARIEDEDRLCDEALAVDEELAGERPKTADDATVQLEIALDTLEQSEPGEIKRRARRAIANVLLALVGPRNSLPTRYRDLAGTP
jgi:hypothetical protein